jgi:hypothetical protein
MYAALAVCAAACPGGDDPPACVEVDLDCQPLYVPTFDNVYTNTLRDGCGSRAVACHSREGQRGGMSFEDPATAHAALLAGRVTAGDASCSELIVRIASVGKSYQMPPGAALPEAERCALIRWVQDGAPGPGGQQ